MKLFFRWSLEPLNEIRVVFWGSHVYPPSRPSTHDIFFRDNISIAYYPGLVFVGDLGEFEDAFICKKIKRF